MTKTLTEQWKDGTLPDGYYYIDYDTQQRIFEIEDGCATYQGLPAETYFLNDVCLIKVIAPVPSYDEYQDIIQQNVNQEAAIETYIEDIKHLQEQLADANKAIDYYDKKDFHYTLADGTVMGAEPAHKYKIKWGVK